MSNSIIIGLIQNAAILLSITLLFFYVQYRTHLAEKWYAKIATGLIIGSMGLVLMFTPWILYPGLVFDTRSILLAITGLFFGTIPTLIAMLILAIARFMMGGDGIWMGIAVVVTSGLIGIIWRNLWQNSTAQIKGSNLYLLGITVHIIMLACTVFLPLESAVVTLKKIFIPVIVIYPLATLLIGLVMQNLEKTNQIRIELDKSEKRWNFALEGSGDGVWDWNPETNEVFFSKQWKNMLGYQEHEIGNNVSEWEKRLHPEDREKTFIDLAKHLNNETPEYKNEHRLLCKDGTYKWILDRGKIIERDQHHKPIRFIGTHTDISKRKKNEKKINQEKRRNQLILDNALEGFWVVDKEGNIIEINEIYANLSGYSKSELLKMKVSDLEKYDSEQDVNERIKKIIANGSDRFESIKKKKNGELWFVEVNVKYLEFDGGIFATFIRDITEKKRVEKELKESEEKYRLIVENQNDLIVKINANKQILYANPNYCETFGVTENQIVGKSFLPLIHEEDIETVHQSLAKLTNPPHKTYHEERAKTINGWEWFGWSIKADVDEINNLLNIIGVGRNISERKKIEIRLKESEEKFRKAFLTSPDSITLNRLDDGVYEEVNTGFLKILGYEKDEIIGKSSLELNIWENAEERKKIVDGLKRQGWVENMEARFVAKNGKIIEGLMSANIIELNGIKYNLAVTRDISERKKVEKELHIYQRKLEELVNSRTKALQTQSEKLKESQTALLYLLEDVNEASEKLQIANKKLEMANKELEAFSYSVSHDLRAPLTRLNGFSSAIASLYKEKLDTKGQHYLDRIIASSKKMELLIDDLLSLSRISRQEMSKTKVNISEIAEQILTDYKKGTPGRKVETIIEKNIEIFCDQKLIQILLENMLSNAWKYTSKNKKSVIELGSKQINNKQVIYIRDNGVGFNMKYADKVFLPFQRLHTENEFEGTGIGMATVQRIINRQNAQISFESEINSRTKFYLTF